jgi:PAS domain S-box-containing protein
VTPTTLNIYLAALFVSLMFQLILAGYAFHRRRTPGALYFSLLALVVAVILVCLLLSLFSTTVAEAAFWSLSVRHSIATLVPPLTVAFLLDLWQLQPWRRPPYIASLFIIPAITIGLNLTNHLHGLYAESITFVPVGGIMVRDTWQQGPWYSISNGYAVLLGFSALWLLAWRSRAAEPRERLQITLIGTAVAMMILTPVGVRLFPPAAAHLEWTPIVSTIASGLLFVAVVVQNLFDAPETARQTIIDRMDDLVVVLDTQDRIVEINPAAQRGLGIPHSQLLGIRIDEILGRLQIDHTMQMDESRERGAVTVVQAGVRAFYDARVTRLFGTQGTWLGSLIVLRDITAQKTAEAALAERERRYRALFEQTNDSVAIVDLDGTIIDINGHTFGYRAPDRATIIGRKLWELLAPEERADGHRKFEQVLAGEHVPVFERMIVDAAGTPHYIEVNVALVTDDAGQPLHVQRIARDVTERKRILHAEQEQRALAEAFLEVSLALNSTLETDRLFALILEQLQRVVPHDTSGIVLLKDGHAYVARSQGISDPALLALVQRMDFDPEHTPYFDTMYQLRRPVVIPDMAQVRGWEHLPRVGSGSFCGAPILLDSAVIGFLGAHRLAAASFTADDAQALAIFAEHVASAIRNARTYEQAQRLAAFEERGRLARDLHDSVSQTLFSAKVTADMLPILAARDPVQALENVQQLQRLIRGALSEMRILLRELRPAALEQASLGLLLGQLADAARGRTSTPITTFVASDAELPINVKIGLYRIAQEAMNNAIKHAAASTITVRLLVEEDCVVLEVTDDGIGFDPAVTTEQGMGLQILRERAEKIGAHLALHSSARDGTRVKVCWAPPAAPETEDAPVKVFESYGIRAP